MTTVGGMLRHSKAGGSALDLPNQVCKEEDNRLRRVLTFHARKKTPPSGFTLSSILKEPLRLVNSLPLNFQRSYGSCSSDPSSRRGGFSRRHYGSIETLASCDDGSDNFQRRYRVENGEQQHRDEVYGSPSTPFLENPEYQTRWYFKYFLGKLHQNYVGADFERNPFFLSVVLTDGDHQSNQQYRAILWKKTGSKKMCISSSNKSLTVKSIMSNFQGMDRLEKGPKEIFSPDIQKDLLLLEEQEGSVNFKIGILYAKSDQRVDDAMFSNESGSPEFNKFMSLLGDKIRLKGWDRYRGGLDVKGDMTGEYSIYTIYEGHEIMFHVSTLLPYSKDNRQQVERKRHVGNDIVNVIFVDGSPSECLAFKPSMIKSQFTHIFAVVSYCAEDSTYRLAMYSEESVPLFGPTLPYPPSFIDSQEFREFLIVKLINGEKAAFNTPIFAQKRERTLDMLLKDFYTEHMSETKGTMLNRRAFSDVVAENHRSSRRKEEARQVEFVRVGQALKLDTIVKGDAPTSLASTSLFKKQPWEPKCFYPDFPYDVISGDSWGDNKVILATEAGIFLIEEGTNQKILFDKTVQAKQMSVIEAHGILLLRIDKGRESRIHVFRMTDFEMEDVPIRSKHDLKEHKLERTKGCHLYALSKPGGSHLRMVVAMGKRLLVLQWRHSAAWTAWCSSADTDTVEGFQFIRELPLSDPPLLMTLVDSPQFTGDNQICVGYKHQFDLVNEKSGEIVKLHVVEGNKGLLIAAIDIYEDDEAELLLCYNNTIHFQKLNEEPTTEFDFQWNAVPETLVCAFPYVLAFTTDSIEIRLIINGNLVQTMTMPKLKLITSKSDLYFVTTAPEFFQVKRERIKVDRSEREPSLSPPSSPQPYATSNEAGNKPLRIYKISYATLTGFSTYERRVPTPSIPSSQHMVKEKAAPIRSNYLSPVQFNSQDSQEDATKDIGRHRLESRNATTSQREALHKEHAHSFSSDSGIGKSIGISPPTSPHIFMECPEESCFD